MSASTRTVQQPQGLGQMVAPFIAVGLALLLAGAMLLSRPAATTTQVAPAPGAVPAFNDHGSRSEIGTPAIVPDPAFNDHGSRGEFNVTVPTSGGAKGLRLRPQ
jgi:hypothetical protein